jgi:hypothetical protein
VTRSIFNDAHGGIQWRSGSKIGSGGSGVSGAPPPSNKSTGEALAGQIDGVSLLRGGGSVLGEIHMVYGTIYMGSSTES